MTQKINASVLKVDKEFEPEEVLELCLNSLNEIDKQDFLIRNLLEGVKNGKELPVLLDRFHEIGLIGEEL